MLGATLPHLLPEQVASAAEGRGASLSHVPFRVAQQHQFPT